MFELSGEVKENANKKYGTGYGFFWVAHNAMLSYFTSQERDRSQNYSFLKSMRSSVSDETARGDTVRGFLIVR